MTFAGSELKETSSQKAIEIVALILPLLDHQMSCFRLNCTAIQLM